MQTTVITEVDLSKEKCEQCQSSQLQKDGNIIFCAQCGGILTNPNILKEV